MRTKEIVTPLTGEVGVKNDTGKAQIHNIPPNVIFFLADLFNKTDEEMSQSEQILKMRLIAETRITDLFHENEEAPVVPELNATSEEFEFYVEDALNALTATHAILHEDAKYKARFDLMPVRPLIKIALLFGMGAAKYDERNWERGMAWSKV